MDPKRSRSFAYFLLILLSTGLAIVQLSIADKSNNFNLWGVSLVCWCAAGSLFWRKRLKIDRPVSFDALLLGSFIVTITLLKSLSFNYTFPYLSPFLSALGIGLLASGWRGFSNHRSELIILGSIALLNLPVIWFFDKFDISLLTAKAAAVVLWHAGVSVAHQGQDVRLSNGGIYVYPGCSGIESILQLLNLGIVFCIMFLSRWLFWGFVGLAAIAIGFTVNACRVALMAYLTVYSAKGSFEYWHQGTGSHIFSGIAVALLGLFCWGLLMFEDELPVYEGISSVSNEK